MSDASTKKSVDCPICGDEFDPTVAGGWCTNTECGEWQYTEGGTEPDVDDAEGGATSDQSEDDSFMSPAEEDEEPEAVDLFGESDDETDESQDTDAASDDPDDAQDVVDDVEAEKNGEDPPEASDEEDATIRCPDCQVELDAEANFCVDCGADVSAVAPSETGLDECPSCGDDVEPEDSFCSTCGEDLDAHREADDGDEDGDEDLEADDSDELPESLVLEVEGREIAVEDGDTVGREVRAALTDAGRPDDEAVRIHREHVRIVREEESFYLLDLGDNPTQLNGETLHKGDREQIAPGDELELSGVASVTIQTP